MLLISLFVQHNLVWVLIGHHHFCWPINSFQERNHSLRFELHRFLPLGQVCHGSYPAGLLVSMFDDFLKENGHGLITGSLRSMCPRASSLSNLPSIKCGQGELKRLRVTQKATPTVVSDDTGTQRCPLMSFI